MTTTTHTGVSAGRYTLKLVERAQQAEIPGDLPAGVKITLRGDLQRALEAAELADGLATDGAAWDLHYPELGCEDFPHLAAVECATRAAEDEWNVFTTVLARATAVTR